MKKFEYHVFWCASETEANRRLDQLGADGWELVSVTSMGNRVGPNTFYLKRELI